MVVVLVTVLDHNRVQSQFLEQAHNLVVVTHVVPGKSQVFLVLLQTVDVPVQVARFDPLGLVMEVLQNGFLGDRIQRSVRVQ